MCAGGEPGKDACKGDGGSPLVCPVDGKAGHYYQAGIVAWGENSKKNSNLIYFQKCNYVFKLLGIGCGEQTVPGVYVNIAKFHTWIDQKISAKSLPTFYRRS